MTTIPFENAFLASPRVSNLAHFQHVLWTSFQVCFLADVVTFWRIFWVPSGTIFEKKTLPKIASKKGPPPLENESLSPCPMAPGDAASRARFSNRNNGKGSNSSSISARARIVVRICVQFVSKFEFMSIRNRKIARKWLLELASIAKVSKTIRKMKGLISKLNAHDLTRHWAEARRIFV